MQAKYPVSVSVVLSLTVLSGLTWGVQTTLAGNQTNRQPSLQSQLPDGLGTGKPAKPGKPPKPGASSPGVSPTGTGTGADPLASPSPITPTTGGELSPIPTGSPVSPGGMSPEPIGPGTTGPTTPTPGTGGGMGPGPGTGGGLEPAPSPTSTPLVPGVPTTKPTK
jgi:hypothetical protein